MWVTYFFAFTHNLKAENKNTKKKNKIKTKTTVLTETIRMSSSETKVQRSKSNVQKSLISLVLITTAFRVFATVRYSKRNTLFRKLDLLQPHWTSDWCLRLPMHPNEHVFPIYSPQEGKRFIFRNVMLFQNIRQWTRFRKPVTVIVIYHRQNTSELIPLILLE
jgi:hypothetical protein